MGKIIGYKVFQNEDEFKGWQREKERQIYQIVPVTHSIDGSGSGTSADKFDVGAKTDIGCFVTYVIEE